MGMDGEANGKEVRKEMGREWEVSKKRVERSVGW